MAALFRVTTVKEKRDAPCKDKLSFASRILFSFVFQLCVTVESYQEGCKHGSYMQEVCNHHLDSVVENRVEVTGARTERRFLALPSTVEPGNRGEFSIEKE